MKKNNHGRWSRWSRWTRWPAVCLCVTLLVTETAPAGLAAAAAPLAVENVFLPASLGRVTSIHRGTNGKTLFYIEDAHHSRDAQESIAGIIRQLVKQKQVQTVFEEGFEGPVPTQWFYEEIPDPVKRRQAAWYLLDRLRLGGAEYAHIQSWKKVKKKDKAPQRKNAEVLHPAGVEVPQEAGGFYRPGFRLVGADDEVLHRRNIQLYRQVDEARSKTQESLNVLKEELNRLALAEFPKTFKLWMKFNGRYREKAMDPAAYLIRTRGLVESLGFSLPAGQFPQTELLIESVQTQKIPELAAGELYREIESLGEWMSSVFLDAGQHKIWNYLEAVRLLESLNALTLSSPEFETLLESVPDLGNSAGAWTREIGEFIFFKTKRPRVLPCDWEQSLSAAREFYRVVEARDRLVDGQLKQFAKQDQEDAAALVFGGFHKRAILRTLESQGWSFAVIEPKIRESSPRHERYYRELMKKGHLPGEILSETAKWVTQERLFNIAGNREDLRRYLAENVPRKFLSGLVPVGRSEVRAKPKQAPKSFESFFMRRVEEMSPAVLIENLYRTALNPNLSVDHASFLLDVVHPDLARVYTGYGPHGTLILPSEYPVSAVRVGPWETRRPFVVAQVRKLERGIAAVLKYLRVPPAAIRSWQKKATLITTRQPVDMSGEEARRLFFRGHFKVMASAEKSEHRPAARLAMKPPYAYEEHFAELLGEGLVTRLEFEQGLYDDLLKSIKFLVAGGLDKKTRLSLQEFSHLPNVSAFFTKYLVTDEDQLSFESTLEEFLYLMPARLEENDSARSEVRTWFEDGGEAVFSAAQFLQKKKWRLPGHSLLYPAAGGDIETVLAFVMARPEIHKIVLVDPAYQQGLLGTSYRFQIARVLEQIPGIGVSHEDLEKLRSGYFDPVTRRLEMEFRLWPRWFELWKGVQKVQLVLYAEDYLRWEKGLSEAQQGFSMTVVKNPGVGASMTMDEFSGRYFYEKVLTDTAAHGVVYASQAYAPREMLREFFNLEALNFDESDAHFWKQEDKDERRIPAGEFRLLRKNTFESREDFLAALAVLDYDAIRAEHWNPYLQEVLEALRETRPAMWKLLYGYYWAADLALAGVMVFVDVIHALVQAAIALLPLVSKNARRNLLNTLRERKFEMTVFDFHHRHTAAHKKFLVLWLLSRLGSEDSRISRAALRALLAAGTDAPALLEGLRLFQDDFKEAVEGEDFQWLRFSEKNRQELRAQLYQDYTARQAAKRSEVRSSGQKDEKTDVSKREGLGFFQRTGASFRLFSQIHEQQRRSVLNFDFIYLISSSLILGGALAVFFGVSRLALKLRGGVDFSETLFSMGPTGVVFFTAGALIMLSFALMEYVFGLFIFLRHDAERLLESLREPAVRPDKMFPESKTETLQFLSIMTQTVPDGWMLLSSERRDSPKILYKLDKHGYLTVKVPQRDVLKSYELPRHDSLKRIKVGLGIKWRTLWDLDEEWVVAFDWKPDTLEIEPVQIMALRQPVKESKASQNVDPLKFFSWDEEVEEETLFKLFRPASDFPRDFKDFKHWWKQNRFTQSRVPGLEEEILGSEFIQLKFKNEEELVLMTQSEKTVRVAWLFPAKHGLGREALILEWQPNGLFQLRLQGLGGRTDLLMEAIIWKKPGASQLFEAIGFENGHLDFFFAASDESLNSLFPQTLREALEHRGLKLKDRIRFRSAVRRSEVRGGLGDSKRSIGLVENGRDIQDLWTWMRTEQDNNPDKNMKTVLEMAGVKMEDYTTLVYPASGVHESRVLVLLRKNVFRFLSSYHLNDLEYDPALATYDSLAGGRVSAGERVKSSLDAEFRALGEIGPGVHLYHSDYEKTTFDFSKQDGKRIWIDKGPGRNAEMRHREEFYLSTLRRGIVRPGDLVLAVPFAKTDHSKYWHQKLAAGVYLPEYMDWNWDLFMVTEEDFTSAGLPIPSRSEIRRPGSAAVISPESLKHLRGQYSVVTDAAVFNALGPDEQEEFYKLFESYQADHQVKFIFNAVSLEDRLKIPKALRALDRQYAHVKVVSMTADKLSFNDEGRRVILVSREGIHPVYSQFVADQKPEGGYLKVRYGPQRDRAGLLAAALLLYETREPESWRLAAGGFLTEVPRQFSTLISDFLAGYIAIGTAA